MRLAITGDGTLAAATRAGCTQHFTVRPYEPKEVNRLDLLWICEDMALDPPDLDGWLMCVDRYLVQLPRGVPVLVSSQIPLGTIARLECDYPGYDFAYSPENLRTATAADDFANQSRIVIGRRTTTRDTLWRTLTAPFTWQTILTDPETAELIKHTLNAFLGLQIAYINEIGRIASVTGANMTTVTQALRTEARISPYAPLTAGPPFGEGHLARDICGLENFANEQEMDVPIISAILPSNR